jgi:aminoglycoside phosphotransferase family enzyme
LLEFYRALRAFVRAKVAGWHLEEDVTPEAHSEWQERTWWYLHEAAGSLRVVGVANPAGLG